MHNKILTTGFSDAQIYSSLYNEAHEKSAYTSYLRGKRCRNELDFFYEVSASFQFPYYFGENWPAFDECISDLEWIQFQRIFIVIDDYSKMFGGNQSSQRLLLKHLKIMAEYWEKENVPVLIWLNN